MPHPYALPTRTASAVKRRRSWTVTVFLLSFFVVAGVLPGVHAADAASGTSDLGSEFADEKREADFVEAWRNLRWVGFASIELGSRTVHGDVHVPGASGSTWSGTGADAGIYIDWQAAGYGSTLGSHVNGLRGNSSLGHAGAPGYAGYNIVAAFDLRGKAERELLESGGYKGYPVLGDSSETTTDAVSRAPVYVRVEKGRSYFLYGDYRTGLTDGQLLVYDRRFTGPKLHYVTNTDTGRLAATVMTARSKQLTFTDVLPSAGVAGYYHLSHGNVVPNSESIAITVAGRESVVDGVFVRPLQRDLDYTIDYVEGTLLFSQAPPIVDAQGNVYEIVARYEYEADVAATTSTAARLTYEGATWRLGLTHVAEGPSNTGRGALGVDGTVRLASWLQAEAEWATSNLSVNGNKQTGNAYRVQLSGDIRPELAYRVGHSRQDAAFAHLHTHSTTAQHQQRTNAQLVYVPPLNKPGTSLSATLGHEIQQTTPAAATDAGLESGRTSLGVNYGIHQWTLRGNVGSGQFVQTGIGTDRWTSTGYSVGAAYEFAAGHSAGVFRNGSTSASSVTGKQDIDGSTGLNYNHRLNERTDWTAGYWTTDTGRQSVWTGVAHRLIDTDALTSNVYTRYQIAGTMDENRAGTAFGINNRWQVTPAVALDFGYERTEGISVASTVGSPGTPGSTPGIPGTPPSSPPGTPPGTAPAPAAVQEAWNASFSFVPDLPYRFALRYSTNTSAGSTRQLIQLSAVGQLSDDVSLSAALTWSTPPAASGQTALGNRQQQSLGFAYRPIHNSRLNALGLYERDVSTRPSAGSEVNKTETQTVSVEASYWMTNSFELATKVAQRAVHAHVQPSPAVRTNMNLYQIRGTTVLTPRWDATLIYRTLQQQPTAQQPLTLWQTGWQASVGFGLIEADPRWKLEAGYRYADYAPEDDPSADAFVAGPFVRLTYRF